MNRARVASNLLAPLLFAPTGTLAARTVRQRPELLTLHEGPYINADWNAHTRVANARAHLDVAETIPALSFDADQSIELVNLPFGDGEYHLVIDKPQWFTREGVAALNLFWRRHRIFTLSFAFERSGSDLIAMIGGIQGRKLPQILDLYRSFTKAAHGMRPRDFIIEAFRVFCRAHGVRRIEAVSDNCRHHRSSYFKLPANRSLPFNYDEVWTERGGIPIDNAFWDIPITQQRRDDVPARKRALYRERYAYLDALDVAITRGVATARPLYRPVAY